METSEFTEFNGNFEIPNFTLEVLEICGQKRAVLIPRAFGGSLKECRPTGSYSHCAGRTLEKVEGIDDDTLVALAPLCRHSSHVGM